MANLRRTRSACSPAGFIFLAIALAFRRWVGRDRTGECLAVGFLWLVLTVAFEILFGRFVVGASWERLAADYNVLQGGLLPFGMIVLLLLTANHQEKNVVGESLY